SLSDGKVKAIRFTRNFGNQNAIFAGLKAMKHFGADAAITIDADLQQDENKIEEFLEKYKEGYDIVAGVRQNGTEYSFFKKITSNAFYKLINLLGVNIKPNHSEFRLISKKVLDMLDLYRENNLFLRGLFYEFGLKTAYVDYSIKERKYGKSKFSFLSLLRLASAAIVSHSTKPLRIIFFLGLFVAVTSFIIWAITIFVEIVLNHDIGAIEPYEIWESFISGIQILSIGIIGEYIGQILIEVKDRPRFLIDKELF
ncbi:MAG: glycosyltransferase, partial [bacterium]|nr:glycosyltransferase [bacterium]